MKNLCRKLRKRLGNRQTDGDFVTFMQVARETPEIRQMLRAILSKDDFNRESILNTTIEEMRYKGAPPAFVSAMSRLLDKRIARTALDLLTDDDA